jgi:hypothetical protein
MNQALDASMSDKLRSSTRQLLAERQSRWLRRKRSDGRSKFNFSLTVALLWSHN